MKPSRSVLGSSGMLVLHYNVLDILVQSCISASYALRSFGRSSLFFLLRLPAIFF
jgi:hypothetical protein